MHEICSDGSYLEKIRIIKILIELIRIMIPLVLTSYSFYCLANFFIKQKDNKLNTTIKKSIKYSIISICIYFIPLLIMLLLKWIFPSYKDCIYVNQDTIDSIYIREIEENIALLIDDVDYINYNNTINILSDIKSDNVKKIYYNKLNDIKKIIDSNIDFKENYSGNIYMGDSRTVALDNVILDDEIIVAKSGGKLKEFMLHANQVKEILNKDTDKTYNIILNYGVNDPQSVYGYCYEYTKFINDIGNRHKIYLVSINPVNDDTKRRKTSDLLDFNDIIKKCMSNIDNLKYCDLYNSASHQDWIDKYLLPDGLHYNEYGNKYIHDKVLSCINE